MESMATTSPPWASPCGKDVSSPRTIRAGRRGSASWTRTSRATTGPHSSALGQRLFRGGEATTDAQAFTVVGVVGAVKQAGLTDETAQGAVYYPYALRTDDRLFVVVRTSLRPESLGADAAKSRSANRPRTAGERPPVDGYPHRRQPGGAALAGIACGHLFADRRAPGRGRHLRRLELRRGAATPRDRRAHGIGSAAGADTQPVSRARAASAGSRHDTGRDRSVADWAEPCRRYSFRCRPFTLRPSPRPPASSARCPWSPVCCRLNAPPGSPRWRP